MGKFVYADFERECKILLLRAMANIWWNVPSRATEYARLDVYRFYRSSQMELNT